MARVYLTKFKKIRWLTGVNKTSKEVIVLPYYFDKENNTIEFINTDIKIDLSQKNKTEEEFLNSFGNLKDPIILYYDQVFSLYLRTKKHLSRLAPSIQKLSYQTSYGFDIDYSYREKFALEHNLTEEELQDFTKTLQKFMKHYYKHPEKYDRNSHYIFNHLSYEEESQQ